MILLTPLILQLYISALWFCVPKSWDIKINKYKWQGIAIHKAVHKIKSKDHAYNWFYSLMLMLLDFVSLFICLFLFIVGNNRIVACIQ